MRVCVGICLYTSKLPLKSDGDDAHANAFSAFVPALISKRLQMMCTHTHTGKFGQIMARFGCHSVSSSSSVDGFNLETCRDRMSSFG